MEIHGMPKTSVYQANYQDEQHKNIKTSEFKSMPREKPFKNALSPFPFRLSPFSFRLSPFAFPL